MEKSTINANLEVMRCNVTLEEALQRCTPPLRIKLLHSVGLVQKAEKLALVYNPTDGFFNTFSGGKDSQAMYHVLELAGVKFKTYFSPTTVDPPEVIRFIRTNYPEVEFIIPKKSMYTLAVEKGMLPSMTVRYCCAEYKENTGAGQCTTIGIRAAESARRKKRHEVEISSRKFSGDMKGLEKYREEYANSKKGRKAERTSDGMVKCINGKESLLISPIFEWTDKDVWEFLNNVVRVPHCKLYDEGNHRIGCLMCPMAQYKQKLAEIEKYPYAKHKWIKAIMDIRRGGGSHKEQVHSELIEDYGRNGGGYKETLEFRDVEPINTTARSGGYKRNLLDIKDNELVLKILNNE